MSYDVCKECGEENPINAVYCQECGSKLNTIHLGLIEKILSIANGEADNVEKARQDKSDKILNDNNLDATEKLNRLLEFKIRFDEVAVISDTQKLIFNTIIYDSIMLNYTFEDDVKEGLANDLIDSIDKAVMPYDRAKILSKRIDGNLKFAKKIEHIETMRASNLSSWAQNKAQGVAYYIVDFCNNENCKTKFEGKIYNIDDLENMPPFCFNCGCSPVFVNDLDEARSWAEEIEQ